MICRTTDIQDGEQMVVITLEKNSVLSQATSHSASLASLNVIKESILVSSGLHVIHSHRSIRAHSGQGPGSAETRLWLQCRSPPVPHPSHS